MSYITFSSPINASLETLWNILLDKIENPQRYIAGIQETKILEKSENGILRDMKTSKLHLKERITVDEENKEIKFTLVDNQFFSGNIINKIDISENQLILTFSQNWQPLNEQDQNYNRTEISELIKKVVLNLKNLAEEQDSK